MFHNLTERDMFILSQLVNTTLERKDLEYLHCEIEDTPFSLKLHIKNSGGRSIHIQTISCVELIDGRQLEKIVDDMVEEVYNDIHFG